MPLFLLAVAVLLAIGVGVSAGDRTTGLILLQKWADRHKLELAEKAYRWFFRGPFTLGARRTDAVFRVAVRTDAGALRRGWVRFRGLSAERADVRWDDEPTRFGEWPTDFPGGR